MLNSINKSLVFVSGLFYKSLLSFILSLLVSFLWIQQACPDFAEIDYIIIFVFEGQDLLYGKILLQFGFVRSVNSFIKGSKCIEEIAKADLSIL